MRNILIALAISLSLASSQVALSSEPAKIAADRETTVQTEPVRIDGAILFPVRGVTAHPAEDRAAAIAKRITALAKDAAVKVESIVAVESDNSTDIMAGDRFIMSVLDVDAELDGVSRQVLTKVYVSKIRTAIETYRRDRSSRSIMWDIGFALVVTLGLIILILLIRWGYRRLVLLLESRFTTRLRELQDRSHDIVRTEGIRDIISNGLKTARIILVFLLVLFYVDLVLSLFPWTRAYAIPLLELVLTPLQSILSSVLGYLPKLVFLIILVIVARYALKLLQALFLGIERGRIKISGFEPEWSLPMYKVVRLAVIALTVVVAYPFIPGSESPAFKGVSIFLGVVFSLGSSSSISNIISGYMVIFRRAFKVGDRVKIGAQMGDVIDIRLQATYLRTIKNEEIIIPNSLILSTEVINFSSLAKQRALILHTSVTIGYDTPWRQIHALLLMAAERSPRLLKEPRPFILQTALNDFYVSYELNVYTHRPLEMVNIYSDLHKNIQDAFNEFGVQIMSPHYLGDPKEAKIVPKEQWHQPPAKPDDPVDGSR